MSEQIAEIIGEELSRTQFCGWCACCHKWKVNAEIHELTVLIEDEETEDGPVTIQPTIYICDQCWEASEL